MAVPPPMSSRGKSRDELRQNLRKVRQHVDQSALFFEMRGSFLAHLSAAKTIGSYVPIGSEVQPDSIENWQHKGIKTVYLPWFKDRSSEMIFRLHSAENPLAPGPFNFLQPPENAPQAVPDLLIIPMLGFDRAMNRIGQGQGHYDRYLAKYPRILRVGLAHSCQEVDHIPAESWDVPMHAVLTEREWIEGAL